MLKRARVISAVIFVCLCAGGAVLLASPSAWTQALTDLGSADPTARAEAVQYLSGLGTTYLDDLIDELANDNHSPLARAGLAEVVRTIGIGASDVPDVALLLASDAPPIRHAALQILTPQAASARTHLEAVAEDAEEKVSVRAAAVRALGHAGAQARASLRGLVRDTDVPVAVRKAALSSLAIVSAAGATDVQTLASNTSRPWRLRRLAIRALGQPAVGSSTPLTQLLTSTEIKVRAAAVEALVLHGDPSDLPIVAGKLIDQAIPVRMAALRGLQLSNAATAHRTAIIGRMLDANPAIQALAAQLVGETCSDIASTVRPSLVSLLASTNFHVRYRAALALYAHGDPVGAATMLADSKSTNPSVAAQAAQAYSLISGQ